MEDPFSNRQLNVKLVSTSESVNGSYELWEANGNEGKMKIVEAIQHIRNGFRMVS